MLGSNQVSEFALRGRAPELYGKILQLHLPLPSLAFESVTTHVLLIHSDCSENHSQELFLQMFAPVIEKLVPQERPSLNSIFFLLVPKT